MVLAVLCATAAAQPVPVVLDGDPVGPGVVTGIVRVAVNDLGEWAVDTITDAANPDTDRVVVRDGATYQVEDDPLPLPVGARIDEFDALVLTDLGDLAWHLRLSGLAPGEDSGVYLGDDLVVQEDTVTTAPGAVVGSTYSAFYDVLANEHGQLLVGSRLREPGIGGANLSALVRLSVDPGGILAGEELLGIEGDVLPGQIDPVLGITPFALNAFGQAAHIVLLDAPIGDHAVYIGQTLIAQEDHPSPLPGRDYQTLIGRPLSLSDSGHWALGANLTGDVFTDEVVIVDDVVIVQEGDSLPDIGSWSFTSFGGVQIANDGTVVFYGHWDDPNGAAAGLFVDGQLVVQQGVTTIPAYGTINQLESDNDGFVLSDNGRWLIFRANLDTGEDGAFLLDLGGIDLVGPAAPVAGGLNAFDVVGAAPGASLTLAAAPRVGAAAVPCAATTSTLDLGGAVRPVASGTADATGAAILSANIPAGVAGRTGRFQVVDTDSCAVSGVLEVAFP